jgi:hypothetical protein
LGNKGNLADRKVLTYENRTLTTGFLREDFANQSLLTMIREIL